MTTTTKQREIRINDLSHKIELHDIGDKEITLTQLDLINQNVEDFSLIITVHKGNMLNGWTIHRHPRLDHEVSKTVWNIPQRYGYITKGEDSTSVSLELTTWNPEAAAKFKGASLNIEFKKY